MSADPVRVSPGWLELREAADASARSRRLVERLLRRVPAGPWLIHDLACGSGSLGRWLAPLLPGPQRWILHDRDAGLLALARRDPPVPAVSLETRISDVTALGDELAGATLVTASALLDLLTADELASLIRACLVPGCPVLFTLSVIGEVRIEPADALDPAVAAAFDAHQRRTTSRGRLLGPRAAAAAADAFRRAGAELAVAASPWRLGPAEAELAAEWFSGWIGAACEQERGLADAVEHYRRRRLRDARAGRLAVSVAHADLLVLP